MDERWRRLHGDAHQSLKAGRRKRKETLNGVGGDEGFLKYFNVDERGWKEGDEKRWTG